MILKFKSLDGSCESTTVIESEHYSLYETDNYIEIVVYKTLTSEDGVCYYIAKEDIGRPYFNVCFVENKYGKTIDRISKS